ncbi:MAG: DUF2760 domain-containing protein [bacterium]
MGSLGLAFKSFFTVLKNNEMAKRISSILSGAPPEGIQILSLLQREGRLIDFLQEDISAYSDYQIGAAVRTVHEGCKKALDDILAVEPIRKEPEGSTVTVEKGIDPSVVRLSGYVIGDPPFTGILKHHGWRACKVKLPDLPKGQDPSVIAPAEVEVIKPPEENEPRRAKT